MTLSADLYDCELRPGRDTYGYEVGHLVLPNGTLVAVYQDDDDLADALARAVWWSWQEHTRAPIRRELFDWPSAPAVLDVIAAGNYV